MTNHHRWLTVAAALAAGVFAEPGDAAAHTDSDVVAVAAGSTATVTLEPTHGCGGSPTIRVAIRAPFEGAAAKDVDGWTASTSSDGNGNTIAEWTGGSLPADETGAFPIEFGVTASAGELLTFPSVQYCENGEQLAWISGDPTSEFPAPRLLVLPEGSEPAKTIDDVPADAPGRAQLVDIVDVDDSDPTETTAAAPTSSSTNTLTTSVPSTTPVPTSESPTTTSQASTPPEPTTSALPSAPQDASADAGGGGGGGGSQGGLVIALVVVAGAAALGGAALVRARGRRDRP